MCVFACLLTGMVSNLSGRPSALMGCNMGVAAHPMGGSMGVAAHP